MVVGHLSPVAPEARLVVREEVATTKVQAVLSASAGVQLLLRPVLLVVLLGLLVVQLLLLVWLPRVRCPNSQHAKHAPVALLHTP